MSELERAEAILAYLDGLGLPAPTAETVETLKAIALAITEHVAVLEASGLTSTPTPVRCALYRHYDLKGTLLYIGISEDPVSRGRAHAKRSGWARFAIEARVTWYDDRPTAELAEAAAIRNEHPLFNSTHNAAVSKSEQIRYLVAHEAWDLIDTRTRT